MLAVARRRARGCARSRRFFALFLRTLEIMAPRDPWHARYRRTYDRPFTGCGCLYAILIVLLIWWIVSWFVPTAGWQGWHGSH